MTMAHMPFWTSNTVIVCQLDAARVHASGVTCVVQIPFEKDVRWAKRWAMPIIQAMAPASNAAQRYWTTDFHQ